MYLLNKMTFLLHTTIRDWGIVWMAQGVAESRAEQQHEELIVAIYIEEQTDMRT